MTSWRVRQLETSDVPFVEAWHKARQLDYALPDLFADNVVRAEVLVDDTDRPIQLIFGTQTIEMYLLSDPNWGTPRQRLQAFYTGHESFRKWCAEHGFPDVFAVIPPAFRRFGKRLATLFGWAEGTWTHYSRKTAGER